MSKFLLVNGDVKIEIILIDQLKQPLKNLFDDLNIDEEKAIRREYQRNRYEHKEVKNYVRKYEVKREVISDQLLIQ